MIFEAERCVQLRKEKLDKILSEQRPGLMLGGFMGTDMRVARAAYKGGCRIFEPNHPAMALQMGLDGVTSMGDAEKIRHKVPLQRMADAVKGIRAVNGQDVFITCGARGTFTEAVPTPFTLDDALVLMNAGADCLHTHKSSIADIKNIADICHQAGLLCEAYIDYQGDFGVQAHNNEELQKAIDDYEAAGVDILGIESGMIYMGLNATGFTDEAMSRINYFLDHCHVYKALEGGVKEKNIDQVKQLGFDIIVMSTAVDDAIRDTTEHIVKNCISSYPKITSRNGQHVR